MPAATSGATLPIAGKRIAGGAGLAPALQRRAAFVELDWDLRQKSRLDAVDSAGTRFGIVLARGSVLRGGDVLVRDDGALVAVRALPEPVLVVRVGAGGSALDLLRAAYHLGNRHVPLEVRSDRLQLGPDPVLADMLRRMGLHVEAAVAPFEPEAGAYAAAPAGHGHGHGHGHELEHGSSDGRCASHDGRQAGGHVHNHGDAACGGHGHVPGDADCVGHDHPQAPHGPADRRPDLPGT